MERSLPFAPVQPESPTSPAPIKPPTLTAPPSSELPSPKALLKRSKEVARAIKQFLRENPSQQLELEDGRGGTKKYPRIETWQFAGACFGYTAMVTSTEEIISDDGKELGFVSTAHAINATGRVISGAEAACMHSEKDWQGKPSFQLRSMAQTRSTAKSLRNVLAFVMVQAGLCATPAEEMEHLEQREITTPCYECGNGVSKKRSLEMRRKHGKELCLDCEKKLKAAKAEKLMSPITDPKFVEQSVAQVQERKAAQPIVGIMDAEREEYA
jgi:hypothetical protein